MYWEYIDIIASNIPQIKITADSQWTARFNIQKTTEKRWCLLRNLSFGLFDHKKFQEFSKISAKFQYFPGLFSNSKTFQDCWEPWEFITHNKTSNKYELFATVHTQKEEGKKDLANFILQCSTKIIELTVSLHKTIRGCFWKNPER